MRRYSSSTSELLKVKTDFENPHSKQDFTNVCDEIIPIARKMALEVNGFDEAIDLLVHLERLTRNASDSISCTRVLCEIVDLCSKSGNWLKLNECISVFSKRATLKEAITKMIQESIIHLEDITDKDMKLRTINTLRTVTEGKIFVEVERARLTETLADIKEKDGDINGAANILGELKVETYGTMDKKEKIKLILHQMRLYIAREDYTQAQILSQKIFKRFLEEPDEEDLKLEYYNLKIILDRDESFLKTSQHYQAIGACPSIAQVQRRTIMANAVLYCILSPYNNEQNDLMENILKMDILNEIPNFKTILELFRSKELINIDEFSTKYFKILCKYEVFFEVTQHGKKCWIELKHRIIEHNILVLATYYTRIYLNRMSELLFITKNECEQHISRLVNMGIISVKIDRPLEIVYFSKHKHSSELLNDWTNNLEQLMKKVNKAAHSINKEMCSISSTSSQQDNFI